MHKFKNYFLNTLLFYALINKYYQRDYVHGRLKHCKYKGDLNHIADINERIAEAERIIAGMNQGISPPLKRGARSVALPESPRHYANTFLVLKDFLASRKDSLRKATYDGYLSKLRIFDVWLHSTNRGSITIGKIDNTIAKEFMRWLKQKKLSNQTYNAYKRILFQLWEMLINDKLLKENPWRSVATLAKISVSFRAMTDPVEKTILANLPVYDPQLWLAVQFVYYDFVRVNECRQLRLHHINWSLQQLTITSEISKSKKERKLIIPDVLFKQLLDLSFHEIDPEFFLFSNNGIPGEEPLGYHNLRNRWNCFRKAFKIPSVYKLYGMKHTGNSKMAATGVNAQLQQLHNGHASLDYTQRYNSGLSIDQMQFLKRDFPEFGKPVNHSVNDKNTLEKKIDLLIKLMEDAKKSQE